MPHAPRPIVIATQNPGKVSEIRRLIEEANLGDRFVIQSLTDAGGAFDEPEEGTESFLENATIKAVEYARLTGRWCLADDSGLEVEALDGAPGVISSHYYSNGEDRGDGREIRDPSNNARLLKELNAVPAEQRSARFVCTMVLADETGTVLATTRGTFEGRIGEPDKDDVPRGEGGFGYDPLFLVPPEFTTTSSELSAEQKNARSHRGAATRDMIEKIRAM